MSAIADDLIAVVLGPKWQAAAVVLQIVTLGVPYRAFGPMIQPLVTGIGEAGKGLRNTLTTFIVVLGGLMAGVYWGLIGLCIGGLMASMVSVTVNLHRSLPLLDMRYVQLFELAFPSMFAAAIMYSTVLIAQKEIFWDFSPVMRLPLEIGLGVAIYGALTLALNRSAVARSLQLIRGNY